MAQQLNYNPNDNLLAPRTPLNVSWNSALSFDRENVRALRLPFEAGRLLPPREGQLFPQPPAFGV